MLRRTIAPRLITLVVLGAIVVCWRACSVPDPSASTSSARPAASPSPRRRFDASKRRNYVIYVPTPLRVVDEMLEVARIHSGDVLYDLGCGDGRIVVEAAKRFGIKAVGIDIDPDRVSEARENVQRAGVEGLVTIEQGDIFQMDLTPASVITMYLLQGLDAALVPQLAKLSPGTRIVSHDWDIPGAIPDGHWTTTASFFGDYNEFFDPGAPEDEAHYKQVDHQVYLWVTPLKWEEQQLTPPGAVDRSL